MNLTAAPLAGRFVRLEPFTPALEPEVRAALDTDPEAWAIMSGGGHAEYFDGWWAEATEGQAAGRRIPFAIRRLSDGQVVGASSFWNPRAKDRAVEIGYTYLAPTGRAGAVNPEAKLLMLQAAFDAGAVRVEFTVDTRNARSQAAVLKLGAVKEGVLRKHKITYTGYVRDSAIFSITDDEWPAVRERLERRLAAFG